MNFEQLTVDELVRMNHEAIEKTEKGKSPEVPDSPSTEVKTLLAAINVVRGKVAQPAYTREAMERVLDEPMSAEVMWALFTHELDHLIHTTRR